MDRRSLFLLSFLLPMAAMIPLALRALVEEASFLPAPSPTRRIANFPSPQPAPHPLSLPGLSPTSLPTPSLHSNAAEQKKILELMARNATCPLLESRLTQHAPIPFLARLLAQAHRTGPLPAEVMNAYLRAIACPGDEGFHAALRAVPHPFLRLTEAAAYLGLLRGRNLTPSPENAIPLLRLLSADLPNNAVPALLLAYALHQLRDPAFASELAHALERPEFRTFSEEALQSLYAPAVEFPALLPAALGIAEQAPIFDPLPVEDLVLERLLDEDRVYAESTLLFGRRLVRREASHSAREDQLFWNSLSYSIGQRLGRAAWKKLHPELPMPADLSVPREQLLARSNALGRISERHFAREEKSALSLAQCEEALPRYAQGLRQEWELASREAK